MQAGGHASEGTTAEFVSRTGPTKKRVVTVPAELKRILAEDRSLLRWFEALSYSIRKWLVDSVTQPKKSAAARVRAAAEQVGEQLFFCHGS